MAGQIQTSDDKSVAGKELAHAPVIGIKEHMRMEFTTKVPLTDNIVKKITETVVDLEDTCKIVKNLEIKNSRGLHPRALVVLMDKVKELKSNITIECDGEPMPLESIINMMVLAVNKGSKVKLIAKNIDPKLLKKEVEDLLNICDDSYGRERIFEPITVDISGAKDVQIKMDMIDEKIESERSVFLNLIMDSSQHYSQKNMLSESDLKEIASQFRALANVKGIKNDILKLYNKVLSKPETTLEVYVKDSGTALHLIGKDGVTRTINAKNVPEELVAQFNHERISKPIDEFSNEIFGVLNGSHAYEVLRVEENLTAYYKELEEFLCAPATEFNTSFRKVLKARMRYEHHKFIGIKEHQM